MKHGLLLIALLVVNMATAFAQEEGCSDIFATNYDAGTVIDDGSCAYSTVLLNPQFRSLLPQEVSETSGIFFFNGKLWTHNDSGGKPILYALDTATFEVVQRVTLKNANNHDWEDVCCDGTTVFVSDCGNNKGNRKDLKIYLFPLSQLPADGDASITVDSIMLTYADQTIFEKRKQDNDYDCEAIFATERYLYLLSKNWVTATTRMYRLEKHPGTQVAEVVNWFDSKGLITGADYNAELNTIAIVGYVNKIWEPFIFLIYDFDEDAVTAHGRRLEMPNLMGAQTEGICFYDGYKCFISAETSKVFTTRVFVADFAKWLDKNRKKK